MKLTRNLLSNAVRTCLVIGAMGVVAPVFAQEDARELDATVVTGSRIATRSVDIETAQPVLVLDRVAIEKQGLTSVAEVLQRVSANGAALNRTFNNGGDGSSKVSLRNLGSGRTLVLVDGRRWASGLDGTVDLNTIPASVIERVEVLKDGASTIYGSDAIAGVINIITRDNYEGAEFRTHYGQFSQGDGERSSVDATVGISGERGNVVIGLGRVEEKAVMAGDRQLSRDPVYGVGSARYSGYSSHGRIWNGGADGETSLIQDGTGGPGIGPNGQERYGLDQFVPFNRANHAYNFAVDNYLLTPQIRTSAYLKGRYDVTDNVRLRLEGLYNERRSEQQLAGYPLHGGDLFGRPNVAMSGDSYFNPYNTLYGGDGRELQWSHRLTEQERIYQQNVKTFHAYAGLEGDFDMGDRYFRWDVGYGFNKNDLTERQIGDANMLNLAMAVGPSELRNGRVVCVDAPGGNVIEGCVPFNPLSPAGGVTQDMLDYILFTAQGVEQNRSESFTANFSGEMFPMQGGMAGFAVGYEHRKESGYDSPDAFVAAGYTSGNARKPTSGQYDLDEFYAELLFPILSGLPGADSLEISLASRYSDYSNFGDTTNSKAGLKWKPFGDLMVRGNWSQGFRAPTIVSMFRGLSDSYSDFGDICSSDNPNMNATIAAACLADGIPADFVQQTNSGSGYGGQTIYPFSVGGNPNLGPEESVTKTLGLVYSPSFVDGLNVSVDWWKIKIDNAISTPTPETILERCYEDGVQAYCNLFTRRADNHQINSMLLVPQNIAEIQVEGWDVNLRYALPEFSFGQFVFEIDSSYLSEWKDRSAPGEDFESAVGIYKQSDPTWRLRSNASLDWSYGDFGVTWMSRYMSHLQEKCPLGGSLRGLCSDPDRRIESGPAPRNRLASTTYHDVQVRYNLPWDGTVKLGVNNVFKKDPPVAFNAFANSFDPQYDIPSSRYMYMEYQQRF